MKYLLVVFVLLGFLIDKSNAQNLSEMLQNVSVTIKSGTSEGSGVLITRQIGSDKVNFVWTAGHVVDNLKVVNTRIQDGKEMKVITFNDARLVKELIENGRRVGETEMDAKVIKFSDSDFGEDLALLMVRKRNFIDVNTKFKHDENPVPVGTKLFHVGSLLGQAGANSMTDGIVSQTGRVLSNKVYDQSNCTAFPGSSGGGIFIADTGEYCGMLVRGAGETFNLFVPIRRMLKWSRDNQIEWAINESVAVPSLEEIEKLSQSVDTTGVAAGVPLPYKNETESEFPFLIRNDLNLTGE